MPWYIWVLIGAVAVIFVIDFIICCPDMLPWNRRKYK